MKEGGVFNVLRILCIVCCVLFIYYFIIIVIIIITLDISLSDFYSSTNSNQDFIL